MLAAALPVTAESQRGWGVGGGNKYGIWTVKYLAALRRLPSRAHLCGRSSEDGPVRR